jgi:hypothetical protein
MCGRLRANQLWVNRLDDQSEILGGESKSLHRYHVKSPEAKGFRALGVQWRKVRLDPGIFITRSFRASRCP